MSNYEPFEPDSVMQPASSSVPSAEKLYGNSDLDLYGDAMDNYEGSDSLSAYGQSAYSQAADAMVDSTPSLSQGQGANVTNQTPQPSEPSKKPKDDDIIAKFFWNERLQLLLERPTFTPEEAKQRALDIDSLLSRFVSAARPIVERIVSEVHLPVSKKTIRPIQVGGIAGGDKFMHNNFFIKFCSDPSLESLYGGLHWAQKAAAHELKSLNAIIECQVPGLHFPLMCLFMCRGYRLMVISKLPISKSTLVYGSADAGFTVATNTEFDNLIRQAVTKLNLKPHMVLERRSDIPKTVCGPVDMEGHLGVDSRHYVCDAARLFPCTAPIKVVKGCHLYKLFRKEYLVKHCKDTPLSSDAFSSFGRSKEDNADALAATKNLICNIVPTVAADAPNWLASCASDENGIKNTMNAYGINMRFCGYVLIQISDASSRKALLREMLARVMKNEAYEFMRRGRSSDSEMLQFFNFCVGKDAVQYWSEHWTMVSKYFEFCRSPTYNDESIVRPFLVASLAETLSDSGDRLTLLEQAMKLAGVELVNMSVEALKMNDENPIPDKVTQVNLITHVKLMQFGHLLSEMKTFEETETFYLNFIAKSYKIRGEHDLQTIRGHLNLAILYSMHPGHEDKAVTQFTQALRAAETLRGPKSLVVAEIKEKFVSFLFWFRPVLALEFMRDVLEVKQGIQGIEAEMAASLDVACGLVLFFGKFAEANTMNKQALDLRESFNHSLLEVSQTKLIGARSLYLQKRFVEAETKFKDLESVVSRYSKWTHAGYFFDSMALNCAALGKLDEADGLFQKAISAKESTFGSMHVSLAQTYNHYASACLLPKGQIQEAEALLTKALTLASTILGSSHSFTKGIILRNLANVQSINGNVSSAEESLKSARALLAQNDFCSTDVAAALKKLLDVGVLDSSVFLVHVEDLISSVLSSNESFNFDVRSLSPELLELLYAAGVTPEMLKDPVQVETIFTCLLETLGETGAPAAASAPAPAPAFAPSPTSGYSSVAYEPEEDATSAATYSQMDYSEKQEDAYGYTAASVSDNEADDVLSLNDSNALYSEAPLELDEPLAGLVDKRMDVQESQAPMQESSKGSSGGGGGIGKFFSNLFRRSESSSAAAPAPSAPSAPATSSVLPPSIASTPSRPSSPARISAGGSAGRGGPSRPPGGPPPPPGSIGGGGPPPPPPSSEPMVQFQPSSAPISRLSGPSKPVSKPQDEEFKQEAPPAAPIRISGPAKPVSKPRDEESEEAPPIRISGPAKPVTKLQDKKLKDSAPPAAPVNLVKPGKAITSGRISNISKPVVSKSKADVKVEEKKQPSSRRKQAPIISKKKASFSESFSSDDGDNDAAESYVVPQKVSTSSMMTSAPTRKQSIGLVSKPVKSAPAGISCSVCGKSTTNANNLCDLHQPKQGIKEQRDTIQSTVKSMQTEARQNAAEILRAKLAAAAASRQAK